MSTSERLENAQKSLDSCMIEFKKFTTSSAMNSLRASIMKQIKNFEFICQKGSNLNLLISELEKELENFTTSLLSNKTTDKLTLSMNSLHIDGPTSITLINNICSSNDFNMDSKILIDECENM